MGKVPTPDSKLCIADRAESGSDRTSQMSRFPAFPRATWRPRNFLPGRAQGVSYTLTL